jgi:hypothetical protein
MPLTSSHRRTPWRRAQDLTNLHLAPEQLPEFVSQAVFGCLVICTSGMRTSDHTQFVLFCGWDFGSLFQLQSLTA